MLNSFREFIDWIDCSPSTGLRLWTIVTLWSLGLFWWFFVPIQPLSKNRSFVPFFLLIWHAFITNYMVVIIGASSLCRTKKLFFAAAFRYQCLALTIKPSTVIKFFKTFLLENLSVKLTILLFGTT